MPLSPLNIDFVPPIPVHCVVTVERVCDSSLLMSDPITWCRAAEEDGVILSANTHIYIKTLLLNRSSSWITRQI